MLDDLSGAMPAQKSDFKKTELKVGYGAHRGKWTGFGEQHTERTNFPCSICKGSGYVKEDQCRKCEGSGKKVSTKIALLYRFDDVVQEEWVNFNLSEPGKLKDGSPKSASTLWVRLKAFSGLTDPAEQNAWYRSLKKPIELPIEMMVTDNEAGDGCVIASVRRLERTAQPAPAGDLDEVPFPDDADFERR